MGKTAARAGSGAGRGVKGIKAKLNWTTRPGEQIQKRTRKLWTGRRRQFSHGKSLVENKPLSG
jgi:hypothetical protein